MAIFVECEDCGKRYRMDESRAGDWVPCRECGADMQIPGGRRQRDSRREPPQGRQRSRRDREDDWDDEPHRDRRPNKSSSSGKQIGIIIGSVAALVVGAVVLMLVLGGDDGDQNVADQQNGNPNANGGTGSNSNGNNTVAGNNNGGVTNPGTTNGNPTTTANNNGGNAVANGSSYKGSDKVAIPRRGSQTLKFGPTDVFTPEVKQLIARDWTTMRSKDDVFVKLASPQPINWTGKIAKPATVAKFTDKPIAIPSLSVSQRVVSLVDKPIMAIGRLPREFELWDLSTPALIRSVKIENVFGGSMRLSPTGKFVAVEAFETGKRGIKIISTETSEVVGTLDPTVPLDSYYEFIDDDHLLIRSLVSGARSLHVISTKTGQSIKEHKLTGTTIVPAQFTSDKKFFALATDYKGKLSFFRSLELTEVGQLDAPGDLSIPVVQGFSSDSSEFVAIYSSRGREHLCNWRMSDGRLTHWHTLKGTTQRISSRDTTLDYLPDNSGWILNGRKSIDRATGEILSEEPRATNIRHPRVIDGAGRMLVVEPGANQRENLLKLRDLTDIPKASVQPKFLEPRVFEVTVNDADQSGAQQVNLPGPAITGSFTPDVPPAVIDYDSDVVISKKQIPRLFFVRAGKAVALVGKAVSDRSEDIDKLAQSSRLIVTDLKSQEQSIVDVPPGLDMIDVNPSATLALLRAPKGDVLHVWSIADNKHVASWYFRDEKNTSANNKIQERFLNDTEVLTWIRGETGIKHNENLICKWNAADGRMLSRILVDLPYHISDKRFLIAVSATGKYLAIDGDTEVLVVDTASCRVVRKLKMPHTEGRPRNNLVGTFHDDGKQFTIDYHIDYSHSVLSWHLASATLTSNFAIKDGYRYQSMRGVGNQVVAEVSNNWKLIDISRRCITWDFGPTQQIHQVQPNGRFFHLQPDADHNTQLVVNDLGLAEIEATVAAEMPEPAQLVIAPGKTVSIRLGSLQSVVPDLRNKCQTALEETIRTSGLTIAANNGDFVLVAETSLKSSKQEEIRYTRSFGGTGGQTFSFTKTTYSMSIELQDKSGETLWTQKGLASNTPPFAIRTKEGESMRAKFLEEGKKSLTNGMSGFMTAVRRLPTNIYEQPSQGLTLGFGNTKFEHNLIARAPWKSPVQTTGTGRPTNPSQPTVPGTIPTAKPDEPLDETRLVDEIRILTNTTYANILKQDSATWHEALKWSPEIKRPVVALRIGFGVQVTKKLDQPMIRVSEVSDKYVSPLEASTVGTGPTITKAFSKQAVTGELGFWPEHPVNEARETVLLGSGTIPELIEAAKMARVDAIVTAFFYRRRNEVALVYRVVDPYSTDKIFESERLTEDMIKGKAVDIPAQYAKKVVDSITKLLEPQPIPQLTRSTIRDRLEYLLENDSSNSMADLAEVKLYHSMQLVTDPQAQKLVKRILRDSPHSDAIATGTQAERAKSIDSLLAEMAAARKTAE